MRPLKGLPDHYNRAAVLLAKTLPQPSLSDEPLMKLLQSLEAIEKGSLAQVLDPLRSFVRSTESIFDSEYRPIASRSGTSFRDLWLPIVLLGSDWASSVSSLLGIPASSWLHVGRVQSIVISPVTQREDPALRVRLYEELNGINRDDYKEFENCVKIPFGLRTTYKRSEGRIGFIDHKSRIIETEKADAERMLRGDLPTWLALLLKWDAVEQIELNYRHEPGADICKHIASIIAVPDCPSAVRISSTSAENFLDDCFGWLGVSDSRSRIPAAVLIILTAVGEEWYQLLDAYSRRLAEFLEKECGLNINESRSLDQTKESSLFSSLMQRHLIFPQMADIRVENEFSGISPLFDFGNGDDKGRIQERFMRPSDSDLSDLIKDRIGNVSFLIEVGESLKKHCDWLLKNEYDDLPESHSDDVWSDVPYLGTEGSSALNAPLKSGVFLDRLDRLGDRLSDLFAKSVEVSDQRLALGAETAIRGMASKSNGIEQSTSTMIMLTYFMFRAFLGMFSRNLDIGLEIIRLIAEQGCYSPKGTGFHSLADGASSAELFNALSLLLRIAVHEDSIENRVAALAGALYVFDINGVIPDRGPDGTLDDEFSAATSLLALEERGLDIPEKLSAWAFDRKANVDTLLSAERQRQICAVLSKHSMFLQAKEISE